MESCHHNDTSSADNPTLRIARQPESFTQNGCSTFQSIIDIDIEIWVSHLYKLYQTYFWILVVFLRPKKLWITFSHSKVKFLQRLGWLGHLKVQGDSHENFGTRAHSWPWWLCLEIIHTLLLFFAIFMPCVRFSFQKLSSFQPILCSRTSKHCLSNKSLD